MEIGNLGLLLHCTVAIFLSLKSMFRNNKFYLIYSLLFFFSLIRFIPTLLPIYLFLFSQRCWDFVTQREMRTQRTHLIGDCACFAFLTPLGIAAFWLCAEGAIYYQKTENSTLEIVALGTLAMFLVLAYFTWVTLCTRYPYYYYNNSPCNVERLLN